MRRIWSRSPATEAISSGIQSQERTEENSIVSENLSIGEDFDQEDNYTSCTGRSQEHEGPNVKITNVYKKKFEEAVTKGPQEKKKDFLENGRNKKIMEKSLEQQLLNIDQEELKFKKDMAVRMHLKNFNKSMDRLQNDMEALTHYSPVLFIYTP